MPTLHKECLWDAAILHAVDMTKPTQPALSEQGEHAWEVGSGQDLGVGHSVLPGYAKDTADASQVEEIESFLLSGICGPRLAVVHQCDDDTGIIHYHLSFHCQFGVGQHSNSGEQVLWLPSQLSYRSQCPRGGCQ